jgi:LysR family malonate utilization transcriptional regulator
MVVTTMQSRINEEISFRKLEIFLAYMREGNLTAAAESLDISTVSVHRAIHSLQDGLRCLLFRHEGRNLVPTDAAHVLENVAKDVIERVERGVRIAREAGGYSSDRLKIGSLYSLTGHLLPELIKAMSLRKPDIQCELVLGRSKHDLLPKLKEGGLDAVFAEITPSDPELICIPIFDDPVYFAAPVNSPYAQCNKIDLEQCAGERIVTLTDGLFTVPRLQSAFPYFSPTFVMEVVDIFTLMNLVASGVAYALAPGRIRKMYEHKVDFIPLADHQQVLQTIGLSFAKSRERDPNLLALSSVVRVYMRQTGYPACGGLVDLNRSRRTVTKRRSQMAASN